MRNFKALHDRLELMSQCDSFSFFFFWGCNIGHFDALTGSTTLCCLLPVHCLSQIRNWEREFNIWFTLNTRANLIKIKNRFSSLRAWLGHSSRSGRGPLWALACSSTASICCVSARPGPAHYCDPKKPPIVGIISVWL